MTTAGTSPLVSIVTPVLNREGTLGRCLESVRSQTYLNVEHIVIDGGSTDGTLSVLSHFEGSYGLEWESERDAGMYAAINKGMKRARGQIVAYLNSDDIYLPWTVEAAVDGLDVATDLIYGDLVLLMQGESSTSTVELRFYPDFDMSYYVYVGVLAQPTVFWRRDLMERIGYFDEAYRLIADCDYWLRAVSAGARIRHLNEMLAIQVDHPETLRARNNAKLDEEFRKLRHAYRATVERPSRQALLPLQLKIKWRRDLMRFRREMKRDAPRHWERFIGLLRQAGSEPSDFGLLMNLLPAILRGASRTWLDGNALLRALPASGEVTP